MEKKTVQDYVSPRQEVGIFALTRANSRSVFLSISWAALLQSPHCHLGKPTLNTIMATETRTQVRIVQDQRELNAIKATNPPMQSLDQLLTHDEIAESITALDHDKIESHAPAHAQPYAINRATTALGNLAEPHALRHVHVRSGPV